MSIDNNGVFGDWLIWSMILLKGSLISPVWKLNPKIPSMINWKPALLLDIMDTTEQDPTNCQTQTPLTINTNHTRNVNTARLPVQLQRTHRRQQSSLSSFHTPPASATSTQFVFSPPQTPSRQITNRSSSALTTPSSVRSQATLYDDQGRYQGPVAVHAGSFPSLQKHFSRDCVDGVGSPSKYNYTSDYEEEGDDKDRQLVFTDEDSEDEDYFEYPPRTPVRFQKPLFQDSSSITPEQTHDMSNSRSRNRRSVLVNSSLSQNPQSVKTEAPTKRYSVYLTKDDFEDIESNSELIPSQSTLNTTISDNEGRVKAGDDFDYESFSSQFKDLNGRFEYEQIKNPKKKNSISNIWRRVTGTTNKDHDESKSPRVGHSIDHGARSKFFHKRNKSSAI
ncbi:hypothetical protein WICPIJ_004454 [Wickerhamomyces pijperi]|uniref:Uncharacterized protein n=1 Tax=Wickerhamomyces pijperi TaxID=599730 RepID=A0A9P8Q7Y2_WICPI|nr:hypothetical protein WICPIJ_004454 [Wickerhamomyces pijperi]